MNAPGAGSRERAETGASTTRTVEGGGTRTSKMPMARRFLNALRRIDRR